MGKWHLGDEIFQQHGFDEWVSVEDQYIKFYSEKRDSGARSDYHHFLTDKGYTPGNSRRNCFGRDQVTSFPYEHSKPAFLKEKACNFLEKNSHRPFALFVNFLEPHMPFSGPFNEEHDPEEITLPENFADVPGEKDPLFYRYTKQVRHKQFGSDEKTIRAIIRNYWGLVSQVDKALGGIMETLKKLGLDDNTIVVYTSDHGDMMGSHGLVAKQVMYEEAVKVPWLMRIPGIKPGKIDGRFSQIDLVPTLLDLMNRNSASELQGESLVEVIKCRKQPEEPVFIESYPDIHIIEDLLNCAEGHTAEEVRLAAASHKRTIISQEGWKLSVHENDFCQLFNLNDDPFEKNNLFSEDYSDIIKTLTEQLRHWQMETADPVLKVASNDIYT